MPIVINKYLSGKVDVIILKLLYFCFNKFIKNIVHFSHILFNRIYHKQVKKIDKFVINLSILVGVRGLEPRASTSQMSRATNCATPRHIQM